MSVNEIKLKMKEELCIKKQSKESSTVQNKTSKVLTPFLVKVKINIFKLDFCGFLFTPHFSSNVTFFSGNVIPFSEIMQPRGKSI